MHHLAGWLGYNEATPDLGKLNPMSANPYPLEPIFKRILSPFERFVRRTTAGGIVLIGTTIVTLALTQSAYGEAFLHFWEQRFSLNFGSGWSLERSLHGWVNEGLMALFFLLVGLELKREVLVGELSSLKEAALPIIAAAGGMLFPALIYLSFNFGTPAAHGWGIPTATDIAFAIGILVFLAWRVPKNLIIFLTALAIADDLGAVLIIALFYTNELNLGALGAAAITLAVLVLLNRGGIRRPLPYWIIGVGLWYALLLSGVHSTIAGVLLAFTIPARAACTPAAFNERINAVQRAFSNETQNTFTPNDPMRNHYLAGLAQEMEVLAQDVQSPQQRIEHGLHPWVTFLIIPLFALSNAGIDFSRLDLAASLSSRVTLGVLFGLVFGKFIGISLFSWVGVRLGICRLPAGVAWRHLLGAAWLGGIGFTMSLFISQLSFNQPALIEEAKLGILLASAISAVIGLAWLYVCGAKRSDKVEGQA